MEAVDTRIWHLQDRLTTIESALVISLTCRIVPHQGVSHKGPHNDTEATR